MPSSNTTSVMDIKPSFRPISMRCETVRYHINTKHYPKLPHIIEQAFIRQFSKAIASDLIHKRIGPQRHTHQCPRFTFVYNLNTTRTMVQALGELLIQHHGNAETPGFGNLLNGIQVRIVYFDKVDPYRPKLPLSLPCLPQLSKKIIINPKKEQVSFTEANDFEEHLPSSIRNSWRGALCAFIVQDLRNSNLRASGDYHLDFFSVCYKFSLGLNQLPGLQLEDIEIDGEYMDRLHFILATADIFITIDKRNILPRDKGQHSRASLHPFDHNRIVHRKFDDDGAEFVCGGGPSETNGKLKTQRRKLFKANYKKRFFPRETHGREGCCDDDEEEYVMVAAPRSTKIVHFDESVTETYVIPNTRHIPRPMEVEKQNKYRFINSDNRDHCETTYYKGFQRTARWLKHCVYICCCSGPEMPDESEFSDQYVMDDWLLGTYWADTSYVVLERSEWDGYTEKDLPPARPSVLRVSAGRDPPSAGWVPQIGIDEKDYGDNWKNWAGLYRIHPRMAKTFQRTKTPTDRGSHIEHKDYKLKGGGYLMDKWHHVPYSSANPAREWKPSDTYYD